MLRQDGSTGDGSRRNTRPHRLGGVLYPKRSAKQLGHEGMLMTKRAKSTNKKATKRRTKAVRNKSGGKTGLPPAVDALLKQTGADAVEAFAARVRIGKEVFGPHYDGSVMPGQPEPKFLVHGTNSPSRQTADCVILGELYSRFVQDTDYWCWERYHSKVGPPIEGKPEHTYPATPVKPADIGRMLRRAVEWAETFWLPDELERRRDALMSQGKISLARRLKRKDIKPTMELARFLYDHPRDLPSFVEPDTALDATPYDVVVWFHFRLYPSLHATFLKGVFPTVQDLPPTALGIMPVSPTTEVEDGRPPECHHTADFSTVTWYGTEHQFNETQAKCIKALWAEWEKNPTGRMGLHQRTIRAEIQSENADFRLIHVFREKEGMHPAWGDMIHKSEAKRGMFYLAQPAKATRRGRAPKKHKRKNPK